MDVFDWSALLTDIVPAAWLLNRGSNVKIAVIDTGANLDVHSLAHLNVAGRKFYTGKPGFTVFDHLGKDIITDGQVPGGHGTRLAGVIAGKADPNNQDQLNGIANDAAIYIIKARDPLSDGSDYSSYKALMNGLELAASLDIDVAITAQVFNLSEKNLPDSESQRILQVVNNSGMLVFCAVENKVEGEDWTGLTSNYFPGEVNFFTKVAVAPTDINRVRSQITNQPIQFLLGGFSGKTYGTGNRLISPRFSNSYATAVMGAIAALCISDMKANGQPVSRASVQSKLAACCQPLSSAGGVYTQPNLFKNF